MSQVFDVTARFHELPQAPIRLATDSNLYRSSTPSPRPKRRSWVRPFHENNKHLLADKELAVTPLLRLADGLCPQRWRKLAQERHKDSRPARFVLYCIGAYCDRRIMGREKEFSFAMLKEALRDIFPKGDTALMIACQALEIATNIEQGKARL